MNKIANKIPHFDSGKLKINNPIPYEGLAADCAKAATILEHFIKGENAVDNVLIPRKILDNAKGIAVITVIKVGFVWTGKIGSGVVVARLPDGRWSAPSSIAMSGVGFGAQIGAQITDFVFVLNTSDAVRAFSHGGNVTLGAQVGIAAGPVGRAADASGSVINFAPIYTYSKNMGLFAGLSLEGSVIITRNDANTSFYQQKVTARQLLSGEIEPPTVADPLYRALNMRFGAGIPGSASHFGPRQTHVQPAHFNPPVAPDYSSAPVYSPQPRANTNDYKYDTLGDYRSHTVTSEKSSAPPGLPARTGTIGGATTAVALYDFKGERAEDLTFRKGDIITIIKQTPSTNDWWTGRIGSNEGDFPANYVTLRE